MVPGTADRCAEDRRKSTKRVPTRRDDFEYDFRFHFSILSRRKLAKMPSDTGTRYRRPMIKKKTWKNAPPPPSPLLHRSSYKLVSKVYGKKLSTVPQKDILKPLKSQPQSTVKVLK